LPDQRVQVVVLPGTSHGPQTSYTSKIGLSGGHVAVEEGAAKGSQRVDAAQAFAGQKNASPISSMRRDQRGNAEGTTITGHDGSGRSQQMGLAPANHIRFGVNVSGHAKKVVGHQVTRNMPALGSTFRARTARALEAKLRPRRIQHGQRQALHCGIFLTGKGRGKEVVRWT
jgi:hypothetical protein